MNCQEGMELMQRYVDGDLNEQESSRMLSHVDTCPDCAAMLERLTRLSSELAQLPRVLPRYSLVDAILPELELLTPEPAVSRPQEEHGGTQSDVPGPRSRRPARNTKLYRRLSGIIAAGIVAGVILTTQPWGQLFNKPQQEAAGLALDTPSANMPSAQASSSTESLSPTSADGIGGEEAGTGFKDFSQKIAQDPSPTEKGTATEPRVSGGSEPAPAQADRIPTPRKFNAIGPTDSPVPAPADKADPSATMGIMTDPSFTSNSGSINSSNDQLLVQFASPDGSKTAYTQADTGAVSIVNTSDGSLVFQSEPRTGTITDLKWSDDGKTLTYTWTNTSGQAKALSWSAESNKETER